MRIDSSIVGMESAGSYKSTSVSVRRFAITDYQAGLTSGNNALYASVGDEANAEGMENTQNGNTQDKETLESDSSKVLTLEEWWKRMNVSSAKMTHRNSVTQTAEDIRQTTLRYIFDLLFAARRERFSQWRKEYDQIVGEEPAAMQPTSNSGMKTLSLVEETIYTETQTACFSTEGMVKTADGREISFRVNVNMSRSFQQTFRQELNLASFTMCDPLVINLDTDVAELSDQTFYFDIDADGEVDEISRLNAGSGYLALDKNNDGIINDGTELFGTKSGDGFADLARYDEDGNGWIDEADAIWEKLQIWCKDENGENRLYRLADKGVGAICLQNSSTDFTLQAMNGHTKGAIRSTGIFLYENGNVGTVQHVDVAKYEKQA